MLHLQKLFLRPCRGEVHSSQPKTGKLSVGILEEGGELRPQHLHGSGLVGEVHWVYFIAVPAGLGGGLQQEDLSAGADPEPGQQPVPGRLLGQPAENKEHVLQRADRLQNAGPPPRLPGVPAGLLLQLRSLRTLQAAETIAVVRCLDRIFYSSFMSQKFMENSKKEKAIFLLTIELVLLVINLKLLPL